MAVQGQAVCPLPAPAVPLAQQRRTLFLQLFHGGATTDDAFHRRCRGTARLLNVTENQRRETGASDPVPTQ